MAKRTKSKAKKSKSKSNSKSKSKKSKSKKKALASRSTAKKAKRSAKRPKATAKKSKRSSAAKKRAPRRTEKDMSWPEVRASRLRKSEGKENRIVRDFNRAVNMTPAALESWLSSAESKEVGTPRSSNASESIGHWSGRRIIEIKNKKPEEYTRADYSHMRKVIAYVARHGAQRPEGDVKETPWRHSLMNWGHDPLK